MLEYACHLWSPGTVKLIPKLEKIQRSFTKCMVNVYELTPFKEEETNKYQIIYVWKILEEIVTNLNQPISPLYSARRLCKPTLCEKNVTLEHTAALDGVPFTYSIHF